MKWLEDIVLNLNKSFISFMGKDKKVVINNNLEDLYLISDQYLLPYLLFIKENKNVYKALKSNPHLFKADKQYEEMFNNLGKPENLKPYFEIINRVINQKIEKED